MAVSEPSDQIEVLVFGLGALGGFYAFILSQSPNVSLSVIARSNYQAVKDKGLQIESVNHGTHTIKPANVYRSTSDVKGTFDYIVCAHKAINQSSVPPLFQANTKPSTTFVLIQNGVGNEDPFRQNFPSHTIISCVAWTGAVQNTPGVISHGTNENLEIGLFPNTAGDASADKQRLQGFAGLLRTGGTKFSTEENIQVRRWEKVVWNAAWNPLTTLSGMEVQPWLRTSDEAMDLSKRLMEDVIAVGRRVGVPLKDGLADELIAKVQAMPNIFSSMYVDAKEGRPLEMDVIVGVPMAKAKELGMDVPALSAVYALTKAVDQRLRSKAADE